MQLLSLAAQGKNWQAWRSERLHISFLSDGIFAGPEYELLGDRLHQFIRQFAPMLEVPWQAKAALEAAGVTGLRELSPLLLR